MGRRPRFARDARRPPPGDRRPVAESGGAAVIEIGATQARPVSALLEAAGARDMGVTNAAPYGGGILTGDPAQASTYGYGPARPAVAEAARRMGEACARHGVAVEINSRPERQDPPDELITLALAAGCLFSIDSDAHAPGQLDWQHLGCERAHLCGVTPDRVVNAWSAPDLLAWTGR